MVYFASQPGPRGTGCAYRFRPLPELGRRKQTTLRDKFPQVRRAVDRVLDAQANGNDHEQQMNEFSAWFG